jgi:hypothetical protein
MVVVCASRSGNGSEAGMDTGGTGQPIHMTADTVLTNIAALIASDLSMLLGSSWSIPYGRLRGT